MQTVRLTREPKQTALFLYAPDIARARADSYNKLTEKRGIEMKQSVGLSGARTRKTQDLTVGSITGNLLLFALPLMAGNLLQQLYNVADTWVVGRFLGGRARGGRLGLYADGLSDLDFVGAVHEQRRRFCGTVRKTGL